MLPGNYITYTSLKALLQLFVTRTEPKHSTTVVNSSASAPTVEMRVVDALTQLEAVDTQIGQELQMIIEVKPADGIIMSKTILFCF